MKARENALKMKLWQFVSIVAGADPHPRTYGVTMVCDAPTNSQNGLSFLRGTAFSDIGLRGAHQGSGWCRKNQWSEHPLTEIPNEALLLPKYHSGSMSFWQ